MKEIKGDIFELMKNDGVDSICITTNGIIKSDGSAVMGAGIALEAAKRWPSVAANLGRALGAMGNHPFVMGIIGADGYFVNPTRKLINAKAYKTLIWSLPTKNEWKDEADMELIKNSCTMLYSRTLELGLKNILMPKIGSGLGKLNWEDVKTVITPILDDRFTVCFLE